MKIIDFLGNIWNKSENGSKAKVCTIDFDNELDAKKLAEESSIELIAKVLSIAEFQTFESGISVKNMNYYRLNVESNDNESSSKFWKKAIAKLLKEREALIIIKDDKHYLADNFKVSEKVFETNTYTDIVINNFKIETNFKEDEVFYLSLDNNSINAALNNLSSDYRKLLKASMKMFIKKGSTKTKMNIPTNYPQTDEAQLKLQDLLGKQMENFLDPEKDAVFPETNGITLSDFASESKGKSYESDKTIKTLIYDVFDFVAIAYGVPPSILKGDTVDTKDAMNNLLTFCINPIAKLISDEVNRKMYGYEEYSKKNFMKCDTSRIKSLDLKDIANSIDLVTRNGGFTIDDTLRALNKEPIGGQEGNMRFITRNYTTLETMLKGGDLDEK